MLLDLCETGKGNQSEECKAYFIHRSEFEVKSTKKTALVLLPPPA